MPLKVASVTYLWWIGFLDEKSHTCTTVLVTRTSEVEVIRFRSITKLVIPYNGWLNEPAVQLGLHSESFRTTE
jgi:hypothetical protein